MSPISRIGSSDAVAVPPTTAAMARIQARREVLLDQLFGSAAFLGLVGNHRTFSRPKPARSALLDA
jgi:hypothetical protein